MTETFKGLVEAQAKARKAATRLLIVKHPIGGLNADELQERIATASAALQRELKTLP